MADSSGSSMSQRRQYDAPGAGFAPQQQYYQPYVPYNGYPAPGMPHYHQQMQQQQQQWYYNQQQYNPQNYYQRQQQAYPPMSPYQYSQHANYQQRHTPNMHQQYSVPMRSQHDAVPPPTSAPATPFEEPPFSEPSSNLAPSPSPSIAAESSGRRAPYFPPVSSRSASCVTSANSKQLPWLSVPNKPFPPRQPRSKRRPRAQSASQPVQLPRRPTKGDYRSEEVAEEKDAHSNETEKAIHEQVQQSPHQTEVSVVSQLPSEKETASSSATPLTNQTQVAPAGQTNQLPPKTGVVIPVIPNISPSAKSSVEPTKAAPQGQDSTNIAATADGEGAQTATEEPETAQAPAEAVRAAPKSWAELLRSRGAAAAVPASAAAVAVQPAAANTPDVAQKRTDMLGHAISSFAIQKPNPDYKLSFLEPRGLINSGNMCYMNSVLQVLVFCVPFYNLLTHVGKNAVHSFKSDTPLLDALILFMREFKVIDAAESLEKLRFRLKPNELEQFGEPLLPEYVYEEIRRMPRFATMQRGHQQDAEEFLGFLFEELQGECAKAIRNSGLQVSVDHNTSTAPENTNEDGWLEVGPKQKASTTRSSGAVDTDTPINRIFGGQLRSELRIPGNKNSVTLEPYQSLQLDIGSTEVKNITDALKGLFRLETLHGDFQSSRGTGATTTKQVFVENLPPVLILHLKRFQYDNTGGTQKIWKKIGYPLELEIPKEAFPHAKRGSFAVRGGLPKYRLISVIYHHGKSATAGHYTTDILRQDERDWLRVDDTYIRRVRSQDVEGASEEDPKILAAALEQHRNDESGATSSIEGSMMEDSETMPSDRGWSQAKAGGKKWSGVVNGTAKSSGRATPVGPQQLKDNKVAYILFYERIEK